MLNRVGCVCVLVGGGEMRFEKNVKNLRQRPLAKGGLIRRSETTFYALCEGVKVH
jgi:hypothetical protein